jgi:hypothetical protein
VPGADSKVGIRFWQAVGELGVGSTRVLRVR